MLIERASTAPVLKDYLSLFKPRVVLLHVITAAAAMVLAARGWPSLAVLVCTLAGGGLVAGASNALNCYLDRDIDRIMVRTRRRPLPSGRLSPSQALAFSGIMASIGLFILTVWVNWIVALIAVGALIYYVVVYTLWLKRWTFWSSIASSGVGAFPPLIGWLAVTGKIEMTPLILGLIIVFWTPPHFWSLAIFRRQDYEKAGLKVIPSRYTAWWIIGFSFLLVSISLWLIKVADLGLIYSTSAIVLGLILLVLTAQLQLKENAPSSRRLYLYSVFYLLILFAAMMTDRIA